MAEFQHLTLVQVVKKKPFIGHGGGPKKSDRTLYNIEHKQEHFDKLTSQIQTLRENWERDIVEREEAGLPDLPQKNVLPLFLQIDIAKNVEALKSFGIEIISEEEDGFIIGANADEFKVFNDRLDQFLTESNKKFKDSAAGVLEVLTEPTERLKRILSSDLLQKWETIEEVPEIVIYVAISSYLKIPDYPAQKEGQTDESYNAAVERWQTRYRNWQFAKDDLQRERENAFEEFIKIYRAEFVSHLGQYTEFDDGFGCKIRISGIGLKELALRFPFLFSIEEHDPLYSFQGTSELERLLEMEIIPPDQNSPRVCVIDSGIQEGHKLLASAIDGGLSISYVPNDEDSFDKVSNGGHGTRVAGALLFPNGINGDKNVQAPFWVQNARILNDQNKVDSNLNEADLMKMVVQRFKDTRIFNLSISNAKPVHHVHMPLWSATIDKLTWENDILFCIAAGNIATISNDAQIPGVSNFLLQGKKYPDYLKDAKCAITNPGYSCFSLTVGSISDTDFEDQNYKCLAGKNLPSPFSRSGLGLWGMIKPDVVEYGGDFAFNKGSGDIGIHENLSPTLIRSTRDNGPAVGRDVVGTSFTTPKVSHIAAVLQTLYPQESCLLYRALIIQSAKIPVEAHQVIDFIHHYGYGIPNIQEATANSNKRVTFYSSGNVNPKNSDIYLIKIPKQVTRPGLDFDVLIEITLAYKAEPRITRQKTNSYLSTWLDWETSRKGETQETFSDRILASKEQEMKSSENADELNAEPEKEEKPKAESFKWTIATKGNDGELQGVKRQDSTVQKDWCIEKSNQLPDEFLIAVKGHKGWQKDIDKEIPYSIVVSFEILNAEIDLNIYELISIENEVRVEQEVRS